MICFFLGAVSMLILQIIIVAVWVIKGLKKMEKQNEKDS
jgi:hypothetical protein